jgi:hypothetical protein
MEKFIESHLYLISQSVILSFYCIGFVIFFRSKKQILISSLFALPQAYFSLALIPIYWNPDKTPFLGIGLEDFIFSFLTGGLVWMCVLAFFNDRISNILKREKIILKCIVTIVFGVISVSILSLINIKDIMNPFIVMLLWSMVIIIFHFDYWEIALTGGFTFLIVYSLILKTILIIWPEFISFWTLNNLSNVLILKMPVEELIWAFLYGLSWSLAIAYILDVQINKIHKLKVGKVIND